MLKPCHLLILLVFGDRGALADSQVGVGGEDGGGGAEGGVGGGGEGGHGAEQLAQEHRDWIHLRQRADQANVHYFS